MKRLGSWLLPLALGCSGEAEPPKVPTFEVGEQLPGGDGTNTFLLGANAFTKPAANITPEHEPAFFSGNSFFNQGWVQAPSSTTARDGLGPLFNARSCAACHFKDGRGRPPLEEGEEFMGLLLRLSVPGTRESGEPLPEPRYGGQLQPFAIDAVGSEGTPHLRYEVRAGQYADGEPYELLVPSYDISNLQHGALHDQTMVSPRVAPAMIGLGLLQAIPLARLESLADPEDADGDGISGRINWVWDISEQRSAAGRFGWKAEQPSVRQQSAAAFAGDLGVTSSLFPGDDCTEAEPDCLDAPTGGAPEIANETLDRVDVYAMLLAVPIRERWKDETVLRGKQLFTEAGCSDCHTPRHDTEAGLAEVPETAQQTIWPYTDLLLHDLGDDLGDGRPVFEADGNEWRTPPLWGLGRYGTVSGHDRLLHDGRARGVAEAILWHGGEAETARAAFQSMSQRERSALIGFVESL